MTHEQFQKSRGLIPRKISKTAVLHASGVVRLRAVASSFMTEQAYTTGTVQEIVPASLPSLSNATDEELLVLVGSLNLDDVDLAGPISRETLAALGREFLGTQDKLRRGVCAQHETIKESIDTANVTALVVAIAPLLGFPATAVPAAVVALSVLLLRIGLGRYCKGIASQR